jgi:hypothetical protein
VAVAGALWANAILDLVMAAGAGKLTVQSQLEDVLLTWEITGLAMLAGSTLAGATTTNGLKQGLCVGLVTAVVLLGLRLGARHVHLDDLALSVVAAVFLGVVGGWFGHQLFPPVLAGAGRKRLDAASA